MNDAWDNFIAGLTPDLLERERMRPPTNPEHERPGSADDNHMRSRHHNIVAVFYAHPTNAHERRITQQREADIKSYAKRKKEAA